MNQTHVMVSVFALLASVAFAQDPLEQKAKAKATTDMTHAAAYVNLDEFIGAKISLAPDPKARAEAAKEGSDSPDRPNGKVKDLLIERDTGNIRYLVVSTGGWLGIGDKIVAVPCDVVTWDPSEKRFFTRATEDQLKKLHAFDLDGAREKGLDASIVVANESWIAIGPISGITKDSELITRGRDSDQINASTRLKNQAALLTETTLVVVPVRFICGTEIDDPKVRDIDGDFGKVKTIIADAGARKIDLVVIEHNGKGITDTDYLLPYESLVLVSDSKAGDDLALVIPHRRAATEAAVKYHKPEHAVVSPEEARLAHDWCARWMDEDMKRRPAAKGSR